MSKPVSRENKIESQPLDSAVKAPKGKIEWSGRMLEVMQSDSSLARKALGVATLTLIKTAELVASTPFLLTNSKIRQDINTTSRLSQMQIVAQLKGGKGATSAELIKETSALIDELLAKNVLTTKESESLVGALTLLRAVSGDIVENIRLQVYATCNKKLDQLMKQDTLSEAQSTSVLSYLKVVGAMNPSEIELIRTRVAMTCQEKMDALVAIDPLSLDDAQCIGNYYTILRAFPGDIPRNILYHSGSALANKLETTLKKETLSTKDFRSIGWCLQLLKNTPKDTASVFEKVSGICMDRVHDILNKDISPHSISPLLEYLSVMEDCKSPELDRTLLQVKASLIRTLDKLIISGKIDTAYTDLKWMTEQNNSNRQMLVSMLGKDAVESYHHRVAEAQVKNALIVALKSEGVKIDDLSQELNNIIPQFGQSEIFQETIVAGINEAFAKTSLIEDHLEKVLSAIDRARMELAPLLQKSSLSVEEQSRKDILEASLRGLSSQRMKYQELKKRNIPLLDQFSKDTFRNTFDIHDQDVLPVINSDELKKERDEFDYGIDKAQEILDMVGSGNEQWALLIQALTTQNVRAAPTALWLPLALMQSDIIKVSQEGGLDSHIEVIREKNVITGIRLRHNQHVVVRENKNNSLYDLGWGVDVGFEGVFTLEPSDPSNPESKKVPKLGQHKTIFKTYGLKTQESKS